MNGVGYYIIDDNGNKLMKIRLFSYCDKPTFDKIISVLEKDMEVI